VTKAVLDLDRLVLTKGNHASRRDGVCIMEAVAWAAGEKHSDHPLCVSPVLGAFLRKWNDDLDDEGRARLKPYIFKVIGTAGDSEADELRAWMCTDWLVRVHTPAWLELGGMKDQADALRSLPPILSTAAARAAQPTIAARDAARDAAWDAARAAARDAAWDAAWAAARAAAWDAAWDAAWAAARDAARAAARDAAWDAARGPGTQPGRSLGRSLGR
jgi:hypothetical protein